MKRYDKIFEIKGEQPKINKDQQAMVDGLREGWTKYRDHKMKQLILGDNKVKQHG